MDILKKRLYYYQGSKTSQKPGLVCFCFPACAKDCVKCCGEKLEMLISDIELSGIKPGALVVQVCYLTGEVLPHS